MEKIIARQLKKLIPSTPETAPSDLSKRILNAIHAYEDRAMEGGNMKAVYAAYDEAKKLAYNEGIYRNLYVAPQFRAILDKYGTLNPAKR